MKAGAPEEVPHAEIVSQHHSLQRSNALFSGNINDSIQEIGSESMVLILVGHHKSHFCAVVAVNSYQPGNGRQAGLSAVVKISGNERHFFLVVNQAALQEPLMRHTYIKSKRAKVTTVYGLFRKMTVEIPHERFIVSADWADVEVFSVTCLKFRNIPTRILCRRNAAVVIGVAWFELFTLYHVFHPQRLGDPSSI